MSTGMGHSGFTSTFKPEHRAFLRDAFGENVSFAPEVLRVYASDASLRYGEVLAMVRPLDSGQVSRLLAWADDEMIPVHTRGRGTSLSGGCVPVVPGIVVSMLGMDRILEISGQDFVAVAQPGVSTAVLQKECARRGLFYPPDPSSANASSLGGNVATCAGGLRAVKYGVTRDYVLGCELVLPGGRIFRFGGRCHKDVVGLDLTRLAAGSEGTLGILTELTLKLIPRPESSASILAGYASLDQAFLSMDRLFQAGIQPAALEFMNETTLDVLRQTGNAVWPEQVQSLLLVQVDGSRESVKGELLRVKNALEPALWSDQGIGPDQEQEIWTARRRVSAASYILGPDRLGGDMAVPRGRLLEAVRSFEAIAAAHGKRLVAFGHAGDGNIHANIHFDAASLEDSKAAEAAHQALDRAVLKLGGSISGEHGAGSLKDAGSQLGRLEHGLMKDIKAVFDPKGIMNPGKGY